MDEEIRKIRDERLEILFERVLREVGGPIVDAHAIAEAGGFILSRDGVPSGHSNHMLAMGLVVSGLVAVRPGLSEDGDDEGQWVVLKDGEHTWLTTMLIDPDGARQLVKDLSAILSEQEQS